MKLHQLDITAFGPFAGKEQINFADLGDNPLFLIDGPTGAGKSSILHAICYALYGETTDADRKDLGLRSDHAEPELLTELTLAFSIRDQHYRITREPTQMRPAKRGGGETEHKATAHLVRLLADGGEETLVARKKTDADAHIREIIGLSADQFRQVMVLPQGRFRELLLAKSDDRQEILSTLFQTEIYKRIEYILKDKAGDIERQYKAFEQSKEEALNDAQVRSWDDLIEAITHASQALQQQATAKDKAGEHKQSAAAKVKSAEDLQTRFAACSEKQRELEQHQARSAEVDAQRRQIERAEQAARISPTWQTLQSLVADITTKHNAITQAKDEESQARNLLADANAALEQAKSQYHQRDSLKAKETQLKGYREILSKYETIKAASAKADNARRNAATRNEQLHTQIHNNETALAKLVNEEQRLNQQVSQKAQLVSLQFEAKTRLDHRKKLAAANTALVQLNEVVNQAQHLLEQAQSAQQAAEKHADHLEMLWFSNQAAVLADKLQAGQPCKVCGSLEHPHPAVFESGAEDINQDAVNEARKTQAEQLSLRSAAEHRLADSQRDVANKHAEIKELEAGLGADAKKPLTEFQHAYDDLCKRLKAIGAFEQRLASNATEKQTQERTLTALRDEMKALDDKLPELISAQSQASSELKAAEHNLPQAYRSLQVLEQAITDTVTAISQIEKDLEVAQTAQQQAQSAHAAATSTVKAQEQELNNLQARERDQQALWQQALADSNFATQADFAAATLEATALEQLRKAVRGFDDRLQALEATLALMQAQLKDQQPPQMDALQQNLQAAEHAFKAAEASWTEAYRHQAMLERTQHKIEQLEAQQSTVKKQFEVVGKMAKAAAGKGEVRVSLERFVLGNLLDSVLSIASQRLHVMSKGQYRLVRQDESSQKRTSTAGLDLAIDDAYSGKTRPVATLSGGESFMASLALALALSDVVQQRSGGIQLDTLFVDEGFGSLDQESLQLAIDTLVDLQASGRTIGIISHVSELKEQMPQRIDVISTRTGSTVKTVAA